MKLLNGRKSREKGDESGRFWEITISELILLYSLLSAYCAVSCCPAQDPVTMFLFSKSMGPSDQAVSPLELSSKINPFSFHCSLPYLATVTIKVTNYIIRRAHSNVNVIISGLAFCL